MSELLLLSGVFVFVLLVGRYWIRRIPPLLHTPLMSMTNAVSGVTVVGAILLFASSMHGFNQVLAAVAAVAGAFNLIGGFVVTSRMLGTFKNSRQGAPDANTSRRDDDMQAPRQEDRTGWSA